MTKLKSKILLLSTLAATIIFTNFCSLDAIAAQTSTVLKVAFNQSTTHPQYLALQKMANNLKMRTGGQYTLAIYPNEKLGPQEDTLSQTQKGVIDMSVVGGALLENLNPDFVVFNLPYVFKSQAQQEQVINNPKITKDLYNSLKDKNLYIKAAFTFGYRTIYLKNHPVKTPADLQNLKIRVMQSKTNEEMMKLLGAVGTPMTQSSVYEALKTGQLDGAENNELIYADLKHCQIAPYYSYTHLLLMPDYLVINAKTYDAMPVKVKKVFDEELNNAVTYEFKLFNSSTAQAKNTAIKAGAKFNEADTKAFQKAVAPLTEKKLTNTTTKKLYQAIRALD